MAAIYVALAQKQPEPEPEPKEAPAWELWTIAGCMAVVVICAGIAMAHAEGNHVNTESAEGQAASSGINDDGTRSGGSGGSGHSTLYCNCSGRLDPGYDGNGFGGPDRIVDNVSVTFTKGQNGPDYQSSGEGGTAGEW